MCDVGGAGIGKTAIVRGVSGWGVRVRGLREEGAMVYKVWVRCEESAPTPWTEHRILVQAESLAEATAVALRTMRRRRALLRVRVLGLWEVGELVIQE